MRWRKPFSKAVKCKYIVYKPLLKPMLHLNWKFDLFTVCRGAVVGRFETTYHTRTWSETKKIPLPFCQMHFSSNAIIWLCIYHKWLDTVSQNASFALYPLLKENISFKSDAAALYQFIPCWLLPPRKENWKTTVLVAYLQHSIMPIASDAYHY